MQGGLLRVKVLDKLSKWFQPHSPNLRVLLGALLAPFSSSACATHQATAPSILTRQGLFLRGQPRSGQVIAQRRDNGIVKPRGSLPLGFTDQTFRYPQALRGPPEAHDSAGEVCKRRISASFMDGKETEVTDKRVSVAEGPPEDRLELRSAG